MEPLPATDSASNPADEPAEVGVRGHLALLPDALSMDVPHPVDPASPEDTIVRRGSSYVRLQTLVDPKAPWLLRGMFTAMWLMLLSLAAHQLLGFGGAGSDNLHNVWFNNLIFVGAGLATAWRAIAIKAERRAWATMAAALLVYCSGDLVWSTFFADSDAAVTLADVLYLAFTPLAFVGIVLLVRLRISSFELDRWIDGMAAALLVSAPGVVFILEPTIRASLADGSSWVVVAVSVAYPLGDIILLGAVIGVVALAGWMPGRAWVTLGLGLACFVAADAFYSVENLNGTYELGRPWEFLWPLAGLLIATSAWLRPLRHCEVHAWGFRAIALPVLCQVAPIAFMVMKDEPPSEQIIMTAVLMIVLVQLVVTRPRRPEHLAD